MITEIDTLRFQRIFGWVIVWYTLYRAMKRIFKNKSPEYSCRIITLLHALIITVAACYVTFFNGTNPYKSLGLINTSVQLTIITTSFGYFLYDFTWCLYYKTEGPVMLLHHVISISFMGICLHLGVSGTEVVATIFGSEITSVFLNTTPFSLKRRTCPSKRGHKLRWFLKEHNHYTGKPEGFIVDLIFVLLFLFVRIGVGGHLAIRVWVSQTSPLLVKLGGTLFYGVNCIFLVQIYSFARYRLGAWTNRVEKSTHQNGKSTSLHQEDQRKVRKRNINSFTNHRLDAGDHAFLKHSIELQTS
uniref:Transmembrane protein 136 n=1 Tax=Phallusia mammillata TaxID=59560 RepID=A0A6F9DV82_9ASCI|nr:transmembrane protein 136 [Phallusia mammillata]